MSIRTFGMLAAAACLAGLVQLSSFTPAFAQCDIGCQPAPEPVFDTVALEAPARNATVDSAGRTWFTLPSVDKLALVDNGSVTYYPVNVAAAASGADQAAAGSQPYDLAVDGNTVWFTLLGANQIGRLDSTTGAVVRYNIPTANSQPTGISLGGGHVWFVERAGDKLGRLDPATGAIVELYNWVVDSRNQVDMRGAQLEDVAWWGDGSSEVVWITGPTFVNSVAAYKVSENRFVPSPAGVGAAPMQVVVDGSGNVWVTFSGINRIGRSALNTLGLWVFSPLSAGQGGPVGLFAHDNNGRRELWYTRPELNRVGYLLINPSGSVLSTWESALPTADSAPWGIAVSPDNKAWVANSNSTSAVIWNSPYFPLFLDMPFISYFPPK